MTYTFIDAAKQLATAPPMPVVSPPAAQIQEAKNNLIEQFPTLETLFGSLDFCECEHCRSVLSPAAYSVDIFRFLDPDPLVWSGPNHDHPSGVESAHVGVHRAAGAPTAALSPGRGGIDYRRRL
jgi:hypothetical protein